MPFSTRLSSTRGTPRGLLGSSGSITHHSKSVRSYRLMPTLNQMQALQGRAIVAELAQISNARTMISRRTAAGYGLGLAAAAAIVGEEETTAALQSLMRHSYAVFCLKQKRKEHD